MMYVGLDWAENHHDVCMMREDGEVVRELRIADTAAGVQELHALCVGQAEGPADVIVGIEAVSGLVAHALQAAGYSVYEINPMASSRYRDRHRLSGAKSDKGDAKMLADVVRTDRHNHRMWTPNSEPLDVLKVVARSHQSLIWSRQDQLNSLRSTLREYYPAILLAFPEICSPSEPDCRDGVVLLERAPTPAEGRRLSLAKIRTVLQNAGRKRRIDERARKIQIHLRSAQLERPLRLSTAFGKTVRATARVIFAMNEQIAELEEELSTSFEEHPDAKIYDSLPGLGFVLGARALAEFGDVPNHYAHAKARKNYATTSPITRASGTLRVVSIRHGGNRRLNEICRRWAFCSLSGSPGARRYYDALRARGKNHSQALRSLANRLVGILHGCLTKRELYSEQTAWVPLIVEAA